MNQDINDVKLPKGAEVDGKSILKVLSATISEKDSESGYTVILEDGEKAFLTNKQFEKLGQPAEPQDEPADEEGDEV